MFHAVDGTSLEDVEELSIPPTVSTCSRDGIQGRDGKTVALTMSQRRQWGSRSVSSMSDTTSMAAEDLAASEVVDTRNALLVFMKLWSERTNCCFP